MGKRFISSGKGGVSHAGRTMALVDAAATYQGRET